MTRTILESPAEVRQQALHHEPATGMGSVLGGPPGAAAGCRDDEYIDEDYVQFIGEVVRRAQD